MREIRLSGSEGGGTGNSTGSPYPYQPPTMFAGVDTVFRRKRYFHNLLDMGSGF